MAWTTLRTFKDAAAATRQAIVGRTATSGEDVPLYNPVFGPDGSDPTQVMVSAGLPVQPQRLVGSPTTYTKITPSSVAISGNGNSAAVGGTGGSAVPGAFIIQAVPGNAAVVYLGDSNCSAFLTQERGFALDPGGSSPVVNTDDLRGWKVSIRSAGDSVTVLKVG